MTRILAVDDDRPFLDILARNLTERGFEVLQAHDAAAFLEQAPLAKPDLIILDIMLGADNGVQVYDSLIRRGFDRKIPVIFLSGLAGDQPPAPASAARNYALLGKPVATDHLVQEIKNLLAL